MPPQKKSSPIGIIVSILVVLAVLLALLEFGSRWYIGKELKEQYRQQASEQGISLTQDPEVSFGSTPLLATLITKKVGEVNLSLPDTVRIKQGHEPEILGQPATSIKIHNLDVHDRANPVAETLDLHTELTDPFLLAVMQKNMAEKKDEIHVDGIAGLLVDQIANINDLKSDGSTGVVTVSFSNGAATLGLKPQTTDGNLMFDATDASLFGFELPAAVTEKLSEALKSSMDQVTGAEQGDSGQIQINKVTVVDGAVQVDMSGHNVPVTKMGTELPS